MYMWTSKSKCIIIYVYNRTNISKLPDENAAPMRVQVTVCKHRHSYSHSRPPLNKDSTYEPINISIKDLHLIYPLYVFSKENKIVCVIAIFFFLYIKSYYIKKNAIKIIIH